MSDQGRKAEAFEAAAKSETVRVNKLASIDWNAHVPRSVDNEDALGPEANRKVWETLYNSAGLSTAGEAERLSLRMGVYVYCAKNGTSREGDYTGNIVLSNGRTVSSSAIPIAAGKMRIRKFLRANMEESYYALKSSKVMESDHRFISKAAGFSISPEAAFATADWLTDCPMFTPLEGKAHNAMFVYSITKARRVRDGKSLEEVEQSRNDLSNGAQGHLKNEGAPINF